MKPELIDDVKQMAALSYTPHNIGVALGIPDSDIDAYMADPESLFFQTYWGAFYESDIKLRHSIFKLAYAGSSPAQVLARRIQDVTKSGLFYEH